MTPGFLPSDLYLSPGNAAVLLLALTATALSALITRQAFRGYRRHGSKAMLFLAVGFAFITVLPFFFDVVFSAFLVRYFRAAVAGVLVPSLKYCLQIVGLSFVLYSLYGRHEPSGT